MLNKEIIFTAINKSTVNTSWSLGQNLWLVVERYSDCPKHKTYVSFKNDKGIRLYSKTFDLNDKDGIRDFISYQLSDIHCNLNDLCRESNTYLLETDKKIKLSDFMRDMVKFKGEYSFIRFYRILKDDFDFKKAYYPDEYLID